MITGKKRILLALLLALTMVFSVMFGTVSALATSGYKINVLYKFGDTLIAQGQKTVRERDLDFDWDSDESWWIARVTVTEDYANATDVGGKAGYEITSGAQKVAKFYAFGSKTATVVFQLSEVPPPEDLGYEVKVCYMAGSTTVFADTYESGSFLEGASSFPVEVKSATKMPSGYQLAAGEPSTKTVTVGTGENEGLDHTVCFKVTQITQGYSYIINVEYRYNGNLVRTGNQVTAIVGGLIPLNISVTPDASIVPPPYFLLSAAPKTIAVSPSSNIHTVVFELTDDPLLIPDEDVPLAEPTTGTAPNMPLIMLGIVLTLGAIGVSAVNVLKQRKSAK
ncbi:MAG: hypothetical protein AAGU74_09885 [Bacillota bacterium]